VAVDNTCAGYMKMSSERTEKRYTRQARVRRKVRGTPHRPRLSVYRSLHHIYVQVVSDESGQTLAAVSTMTASIREEIKSKSGVTAAKLVGKAIAERCREAGINEVVFDRNGFLYHGRVKALADAAREAGLRF
jgi:large subunit ribosomal protein L18